MHKGGMNRGGALGGGGSSNVDLSNHPSNAEMNQAIQDAIAPMAAMQRHAARSVSIVDHVNHADVQALTNAHQSLPSGDLMAGIVGGSAVLYAGGEADVEASSDGALGGVDIGENFTVRLASDDFDYEWNGTEWAVVDAGSVRSRVVTIEENQTKKVTLQRAVKRPQFDALSGTAESQGWTGAGAPIAPETNLTIDGVAGQYARNIEYDDGIGDSLRFDLEKDFLAQMMLNGGIFTWEGVPIEVGGTVHEVSNFKILISNDNVPQNLITSNSNPNISGFSTGNGVRLIAYPLIKNGKLEIKMGDAGNAISYRMNGQNGLPNINAGGSFRNRVKIQLRHNGGKDINAAEFSDANGGLTQVQFDLLVNDQYIATTQKGKLFTHNYNTQSTPSDDAYIAHEVWLSGQHCWIEKFGFVYYEQGTDILVTKDDLENNDTIDVLIPPGEYNARILIENARNAVGKQMNVVAENTGTVLLEATNDGGDAPWANFNGTEKRLFLSANTDPIPMMSLLQTADQGNTWTIPLN